MSQQEALEALDPTGMLRKLGIPSDHAGESIAADRHLSDIWGSLCVSICFVKEDDMGLPSNM